MRRLTLFLAITLAGLPATPALTQETGTRLPTYRNRADFKMYNLMSAADRGRMVMLGMARCIERYNPPGVQKALKMFPGSPEETRQLEKVITPECLTGNEWPSEIRFSHALARGAFFTAVYLNKFGNKAGPLSADTLNLAPDTVGQNAEAAQTYTGLRRFAECVIRADPAGSRAILTHPIGSKEESAAYQALGPTLGSCLPQGMKISFSKSVLGGLFAEVLYRLSTVSTAGIS